MRAGHASRTAQHNALFRALESARGSSRRIFHDPLARAFLAWPYSAVPPLAGLPGVGDFVPWFIDRRWPGTRTSVVARTRLIDELLGDALGEGVEQFVVLGAGFDTRAYRLDGLRDVAVFEVDHPDTQGAKRRALEAALGAIPGHVRFVPIDFARDDLPARMRDAGYQESVRSVILWEGVTNYLTAEAVDATLRWCAGAAPDSRLLFTYVHTDILTAPEKFVGSARLFAALERAGERFTFGIDPARLREFLASRGLTLESDVGAADYRARIYGGAARRMRGHEFYRVAAVRVGSR